MAVRALAAYYACTGYDAEGGERQLRRSNARRGEEQLHAALHAAWRQAGHGCKGAHMPAPPLWWASGPCLALLSAPQPLLSSVVRCVALLSVLRAVSERVARSRLRRSPRRLASPLPAPGADARLLTAPRRGGLSRLCVVRSVPQDGVRPTGACAALSLAEGTFLLRARCAYAPRPAAAHRRAWGIGGA